MAKEKNTVDPLEAAAIEASRATASKAVSVKAPAGPVQEPELPGTAALRDEPKRAPSYEVLRDITVSNGASMLKLRCGDVISEESYGDGAIARFREAGVSLKEV